MPMPAPTPEMIALARQRYLDGITVSRIVAEAQMSHGTLYYCLDGCPDENGIARLPPIRRRRTGLSKRRKPLRGSPLSLVNRLWRTAEMQVRDIEDRLRLNKQPPDERERDARLLSVLVKTVRDLRALHDVEASSEDEDGPDNLDDFRRDLVRKIDGIIARRSPAAGGEPKR